MDSFKNGPRTRRKIGERRLVLALTDHYSIVCPRHAGFLTDLDILTPDGIELEPIYVTFGARMALDGLWCCRRRKRLRLPRFNPPSRIRFGSSA